MDSHQQLLYALYVFCKTQEKCGPRVRAILDSLESSRAPKGYEPFAGESPSVPPIGGCYGEK